MNHELILHQSLSDSTDGNDTATTANNASSSLSIATQQGIYVTPHPPVGLVNYGNTCYANATLQCLMSTALASALLDPRCFVVFRRYASNVKLLEASAQQQQQQQNGSGRYDYEENDVVLRKQSTGSDHSETSPSYQQQLQHTSSASGKQGLVVSDPSSKIHKSNSDAHSHSSQSMNTKRQLHMKSETCRWLTDELVRLCQKYRASPTTSFFGRVEPVDPGAITRNVSRLSKCLHYGRQEDAHEFLRALLGTLVMDGQNKKLSALFDGLLESAVTCCTCGYSSLTRDRYMDLSLEIESPDCNDLMSALRHFTRTETLSEDNLVECAHCQKRRKVTKGLRLATAPTILVLHLKRFSYDRYGRLMRLSKHISFPSKLSIAEFMSRANRSIPRLYELVGVLVHLGRSCNHGHYLAYVNSGGIWYKASDSDVEPVPETTVLEQGAYMLLYQVESVKKHRAKGLVKVRPGMLPEKYPNRKESTGPFSLAKLINIFDSCGMTSMGNCWGQIEEEREEVIPGPLPTQRVRSASSVDTEKTGKHRKSNSISRSRSTNGSRERTIRNSRSESPHVRHRNTSSLKAQRVQSSHVHQEIVHNYKLIDDSTNRRNSTGEHKPIGNKDEIITPQKYPLVRGASSGNLKERNEAAAKAYSSANNMGKEVELSSSINISTPKRESSKGSPYHRHHSSSPRGINGAKKFPQRSYSSLSADNEKITLPPKR